MKLRIKFQKHGAIRFIGHLDVMRFFQKSIRRAEIDVAYSQGFSPHQIMSFAQPLSVGHESNGEYMDIEVHSMTDCEDIKRRLNQASVAGIEVVSVIKLPDNATNAMASVAAAEYTVQFREGRTPALLFALDDLDMKAVLAGFLNQEHILYQKETKKGIREVDLKPGIYKLSYTKAPGFHMLLDASSGSNIKPSQVIEALLQHIANQSTQCEVHSPAEVINNILPENALLVTREDTYTNIGTEDAPKLVPLDHASLMAAAE